MEPTCFDIRPFESKFQSEARKLVLEGFRERFGMVDETLNPDLDNIERHYVETGNLFVVALHGDRVVGTGGLTGEGVGRYRIVRVSVHAEYRRRGLARTMIDYLFAHIPQGDAVSVLVETNRHWYDAMRLYESLGFRVCKEDGEVVHLILVI